MCSYFFYHIVTNSNNYLYFDTGNSNKRRIIHIQALCEKIKREIQESILGLHAFTGCDSISAFVQKGKKKPLTLLLKHLEFVPAFKELGERDTLSQDMLLQLEIFVCHLYHSQLSYVHGLDISLLPPCQQALRMHIMRANYQAHIWKQAHTGHPDIPNPSGHG